MFVVMRRKIELLKFLFQNPVYRQYTPLLLWACRLIAFVTVVSERQHVPARESLQNILEGVSAAQSYLYSISA